MDFKNWALELVEQHKNPLVRFEIEKNKLFLPNGDEEEGDILAQRIESFKKVLQSHRVERRCARNKIKWLLEDEIGVVEKSVGVKHKFMGFQNKNGRFVYPEEAFFLLETNRAEILYNNIPLNIDQAFAMILKTREALNKYRIYQKLAVAGYVLKKPNLDIKSVKHNLSKIEKLQLIKIKKANTETSLINKTNEETIGDLIQIDKSEPPAKKTKRNHEEIKVEELPSTSILQDYNGSDKFKEIFLKLQARGPKHNKCIVDKSCDFKVELNTSGKSKQGSLHFIIDGELDPGIGFYKEDDLNIYCNATTDVIFTRISSVELPNLF